MKIAQIDFDHIYKNVTPVGSPTIKLDSTFTIGGAISALLPYVYTAIGILLMLYLVLGGFQYMTSGGDPKKTESAKSKITNAFIGFLIVFVSYWIVEVVGLVLGIDEITNVF